MLVKFPVPEFRVAILPVEAVRVVNTAVIAFRMLVARLPVTVKLLAVVEASVEEPLTVRLVNSPVAKDKIFPRIFVTVVLPRVVEPAERLVVFRLVDVEFVIVPLVALMFESDRFPAERVVIVALVRVALVPTRLSVFVVVAFVVDE